MFTPLSVQLATAKTDDIVRELAVIQCGLDVASIVETNEVMPMPRNMLLFF